MLFRALNPAAILGNFTAIARREGAREAVRAMYRRTLVRYHEHRLRVNTEAVVAVEELGFHNPECRCYAAVDYRFSGILRSMRLKWKEHEFLDLGCGMGRAVLIAAGLPFGRVIGLDLSAELVAIARGNLGRALPKLRCKDVELMEGDATAYHVPPGVTLIFVCNSFNGSVLKRVLENIASSVRMYPRRVTMIFALPPESACERDLSQFGSMLRLVRATQLEQTRFLFFEVDTL